MGNSWSKPRVDPIAVELKELQAILVKFKDKLFIFCKYVSLSWVKSNIILWGKEGNKYFIFFNETLSLSFK